MEIQKITYDTKKYIRNDPNYPKTQTITDEDMNEIKSVVNNNAYKQDEDYLKLKNAVLNAETEESKSIHVEDANKFGQLEVLGNHGQKTRDGYNILPNNLTNTTINGVTFTINEDKSVTVNGTATASIIANLITGEYNDNNATEPLIIPDNITNCRLSGCPSGGSSSTYKLDIYNQKYALLATDWGEGTNVTIDSQEDKKITRVRIIIYSGATVNNLTFKPMLVAGTEEREYEQYGASPSPKYPSPVKCLGSNKNELDLKAQSQYGITVTKNADDTLNITGTATASGNLSLLNKNIVLKANKSYTFSVKKVSGQDISNSIWFWNATDSNSEITLTLLNNIKTFTFTKDTTLSALNISVNQGDVFDITLALKLEEGTEATSYSPYNQGSTKISKINKNLFNKETAIQGLLEGDGSLSYSDSRYYTSDFIQVIPGQTYYKTYSGSSRFKFFDKNKNPISNTYNDLTDPTGAQSFEIPENAHYIRFTFLQTSLDSIQIEKSSDGTEYIEHQQTDYLLYIQREMLKRDYFAKEADGWKEVHNFNKYTFTGTEDYIKSSISNDNYLRTYTRDSIISSSIMKMDGKMFATRYINIGIYSSSTADNRIACRPQLHTQISTEFLTENTAEAYKSLLTQWNNEGYPLTVFYELATPTKLPCTEEQSAVLEELSNLELFDGTNNIITAEDIALLKLKYALDVETYIDNKLNAINQQILNIA